MLTRRVIHPALTCAPASVRRVPHDNLAVVAERIYPDKPYLQSEWLRAVAVVRGSSRGWLLDQPTERRHA